MKFRSIAAALLALLLVPAAALAQSPPTNPSMTYGMVPTVGQWNNWFAQKQNTLGYVPLNVNGGTLLGKLSVLPSATTGAGLNLGQGVAPLAPNNGDTWVTSAGMYAQAGGVTYGPFAGFGTGNFAATSPITVSFPSSVVTYALGTVTAAKGGTGLTTLTSHGVLTGNGTGNVAVTAAPTAGQLLIGQTSAAPSPQTMSGDCTIGNTGVITCSRATGSLLNVQTFTASGTYTRTSGTTTNTVYSVGGGGSGGGATTTSASTISLGVGGGGGAMCIQFNAVAPATAVVTIGAAGTTGTGAGGTGGTSSFNGSCQAIGGVGGGVAGPSGVGFAAISGVGGAASATGTIDMGGQQGSPAFSTSVNQVSGSGGSSLFGAGGVSVQGATASTGAGGVAATGFGAGGGGAQNGFSSAAHSGGAGTGGIIIVYEYR